MKFTIRYDEKTWLYWSLSNTIATELSHPRPMRKIGSRAAYRMHWDF
jgi:hypothetical protein